MLTRCPECSSEYEVEQEIIGSEIECAECNNVFTARQRLTLKTVAVQKPANLYKDDDDDEEWGTTEIKEPVVHNKDAGEWNEELESAPFGKSVFFILSQSVASIILGALVLVIGGIASYFVHISLMPIFVLIALALVYEAGLTIGLFVATQLFGPKYITPKMARRITMRLGKWDLAIPVLFTFIAICALIAGGKFIPILMGVGAIVGFIYLFIFPIIHIIVQIIIYAKLFEKNFIQAWIMGIIQNIIGLFVGGVGLGCMALILLFGIMPKLMEKQNFAEMQSMTGDDSFGGANLGNVLSSFSDGFSTSRAAKYKSEIPPDLYSAPANANRIICKGTPFLNIEFIGKIERINGKNNKKELFMNFKLTNMTNKILKRIDIDKSILYNGKITNQYISNFGFWSLPHEGFDSDEQDYATCSENFTINPGKSKNLFMKYQPFKCMNITINKISFRLKEVYNRKDKSTTYYFSKTKGAKVYEGDIPDFVHSYKPTLNIYDNPINGSKFEKIDKLKENITESLNNDYTVKLMNNDAVFDYGEGIVFAGDWYDGVLIMKANDILSNKLKKIDKKSKEAEFLCKNMIEFSQLYEGLRLKYGVEGRNLIVRGKSFIEVIQLAKDKGITKAVYQKLQAKESENRLKKARNLDNGRQPSKITILKDIKIDYNNFSVNKNYKGEFAVLEFLHDNKELSNIQQKIFDKKAKCSDLKKIVEIFKGLKLKYNEDKRNKLILGKTLSEMIEIGKEHGITEEVFNTLQREAAMKKYSRLKKKIMNAMKQKKTSAQVADETPAQVADEENENINLDNKLYFLNDDTLKSRNLETGVVEDICSDIRGIEHTLVDPKTGCFYYTTWDSMIKSINLNDDIKRKTISILDFKGGQGLAFDSDNKVLYYGLYYKGVYSKNLENEEQKLLVPASKLAPGCGQRGQLQIDTKNKHIYFRSGQNGPCNGKGRKIWRVDFNGKNLKMLYQNKGSDALALDLKARKMYFSDAPISDGKKPDVIKVSDLSGKNSKILFSLKPPYKVCAKIAVDNVNRKLYLGLVDPTTKWKNHALMKVDFNGENQEIINETESRLAICIVNKEPAQVADETPAQVADEELAQVADEEPAQVAKNKVIRVAFKLSEISVAEKIKTALNFTSKTNPDWIQVKNKKLVPLWKKLEDLDGVFVLKTALKQRTGSYLKVTGDIKFAGQAYFNDETKKFCSVEENFAKSAKSLIIHYDNNKYSFYKNGEISPFYELSGIIAKSPHFFIKGNIKTSEFGNKKFQDIK